MSLSIIFSVSCGANLQAPSGELPAWKVGDTWTIKVTLKWLYENESVSTVVYSVISEQAYNGMDCYIVKTQDTTTSTSIPLGFNTIQAYDKTTLRIIGTTDALNLSETNSSTFFLNTSIQYSAKPYPLSVGKTWTTTDNTTYIEENQTTTVNSSSIYKVEGIESITVPAGTFNCFKIVIYSNKNEPLETYWVTDVTKGFPVKRISNQGAFTTELVSYSISK